MATSNITASFAETVRRHPYYPVAASIPHFAPNKDSVPYLLATFFTACALLLTATHHLTTRVNPQLSRTQLATVLWFVLSGSIHLFFEGYYVSHFRTLAANQTLIGQMWKEYALSDSRYLTSNGFVLCVESLTVVTWGPGCLLAAWLVARGHPAQCAVIAVVSLGQMYGDVLYYASSFFDEHVDGVSYSRPESFYYWFYFVLMNAFWIVIPGALLYRSLVEMTHAVAVVHRLKHGKKLS